MNRINLICLGVKDMAISLAFYKKLGFKTYTKENNPPIVFFDNEGTKLELFPLEELAKDINGDAPPAVSSQGFSGITLAINVKSIEEVDNIFSKVVESGGVIAKRPQKNSIWEGYSGYFTDPDGYYWEIAYGKEWNFDQNNMLIIE